METLVLPPVDSLRKKRKEASLPVEPSLRPVTQGRCCWFIYLARAGGSARQLSRSVAAPRESCPSAMVTSRFGSTGEAGRPVPTIKHSDQGPD